MKGKVGLFSIALTLAIASTGLFAQSFFFDYSYGVGAKLFSSSYHDSTYGQTSSVTSAGVNFVAFLGRGLGFYSDVSVGVPVGASASVGALSQYDQLKLSIDEVGPIGFEFSPTRKLLVILGGPINVDAVMLDSKSFAQSGWMGYGAGLSGQAIYRFTKGFGVYADGTFGYDLGGITLSAFGSYGGGYAWGGWSRVRFLHALMIGGARRWRKRAAAGRIFQFEKRAISLASDSAFPRIQSRHAIL